MQHSADKILALSPGTREMGVAVFENNELLYYGTKDLRQRRCERTDDNSGRKAVCVISQLIRKYRPSGFILRRLQPSQRRSPKLTRIASRLKATARRRGLPYCEVEPRGARKFLCPEGRATRKTAAESLARLYPELSRQARGGSHSRRQYYEPMFDAIAVGYFCQQKDSLPPMADRTLSLTYSL